MAAEIKKEIQLEIAHVLFIDIVGYSKLLIDEQRSLLETLNEIVRSADEFRAAETAGRLLKIPTGDGMALAFYNSPEAPVECALQISRALKNHPELRMRMGVHSGPVSGVVDVNERANIAGAGINMAQRVMDCGDAGHILLSKRVAEDLAHHGHWRPHLHDLGECEVKHGVAVSIVNLYTGELGNPELPEKFTKQREHRAVSPVPSTHVPAKSRRWALLMIAIFLVAGGLLLWRPSASKITRSPATPAKSTLTQAIPEKSIAVLPFENLSANQENAFFADGVQDEILTDLARIADLKVISRTSVMQYKSGVARNLPEIGRQLSVAHVLEGSVQRAGGKVRVNAQLIDARTDSHLWAQTYDRDLADVFTIQSEIAEAIADQLKTKLSASEKAAIEEPPTADLEAFDLYTRAKTLLLSITFNALLKENLLQGTQLLDQAVARDPNFFLAYCQLVYAHGIVYLVTDDHTPARRALADAALRNVVRLRPDAGETHLVEAEYYYRCYQDYERSRTELGLARRTLPNNSKVFELTGYIDRRQGRWDESARNLERALQLDPRNFFILQQISLSYHYLRRYGDMAAALDRALALAPGDIDTRVTRAYVELERRADPKPLHETIHGILRENQSAAEGLADQWLYLALCEHDPAEAARALAFIPPKGITAEGVNFSRRWCEGLAARARGDAAAAETAFRTARAEQERTVREQADYGPPLSVLGMIDAALGRKEDAIREGRRAVELLPIAKDSAIGAKLMEDLAIIYAWSGENDLALEQLTLTLKSPGDLSYGNLRLHPYWESLHGFPRFEKIISELAPK
jgi:TolB-like protein/class 3 adenylate cyclase